MNSYVRRQIERVLAAGTDGTGKFRVKIAGKGEETQWLSLTHVQLAAVIEAMNLADPIETSEDASE